MNLLRKLTDPKTFRVWIILWLMVLTFEVYDVIDVDIDVNYEPAFGPVASWIELNYQLVLSILSLAGAGLAAMNGGKKGRRRKTDSLLDDDGEQPVTLTAAELIETVELVLRATATEAREPNSGSTR